jgi:hypothetical protein
MGGRSLLLTVCVVLSLSACASDSTFTIAGREPNPKAFEEDASSCSGVGSSVLNFFGGALNGAAAGAALGVQASLGRPDAAAVGAAAGGALGLLIGAGKGIADSVSGDNYDLCMVQKGYQRVDPHLTEIPAAPAVTRRAAPIILDVKPDPAR